MARNAACSHILDQVVEQIYLQRIDWKLASWNKRPKKISVKFNRGGSGGVIKAIIKLDIHYVN